MRRRKRRRDSAPAQEIEPAPTGDVEAGSEIEPGAEVDEVNDVVADLATIDAADSEVVLARAIELADHDSAVAEQFPIGSVEEVAAELHVPAGAVADAIAEYRAGAIPGVGGEPDKSLLDRIVGPRSVRVRHRAGVSDDVAVERLSDWLARRHRLRIRVSADGTVVGIRRRGMVPVVVRSVRSATGRGGLAGVREVRAAAVSGEPGRTSFCVVADVSDQRAQSVAAGSAVALGGSLVVAAAAVVTAPMTLVGVPVAVGAGWVTSRVTHRYRVRKVEEEVEITADQVAAGAPPQTITKEITDRLERVARSRRSSE